MVKFATRWVGRRPYRRSACLIAIGVTVGLGVAGAVAGAAILAKAPRDRAAGSFSIRVAPATRTVAPGASTTYAVRLQLGPRQAQGLSGRTRLSVGLGAPTGADISFSPQSTVVPRGTSHRPSKLTIHTRAGTAAGTYRFQVRAGRPHSQGKNATVTLIVAGRTAAPPTAPPVDAPAPPEPVVTTPEAFTIAGALPGLLIPGSEAPLDLSLTNREDADLSISALTVRVAVVSAPRSDALHPCSPADFSVAQLSGTQGLTLPTSETATLTELGVSAAQLPRITMVDSAANQNGCKSASLQLAFTGTATKESK
jgi:hypothetical protein